MKKLIVLYSLAALCLAQSPPSSQPARPSPEWLKSGVIYQVFTRSFSQEGTFAGVTKRLDELHSLGVNILWLMPIHPSGELKKKGTLGSAYSVRDYYAIDPALGGKERPAPLGRRSPSTANEGHHRHGRQSHRLGQRHDGSSRFLQERQARQHYLSLRLDRRRRARLCQSRSCAAICSTCSCLGSRSSISTAIVAMPPAKCRPTFGNRRASNSIASSPTS